jgi:hypothetical protein
VRLNSSGKFHKKKGCFRKWQTKIFGSLNLITEKQAQSIEKGEKTMPVVNLEPGGVLNVGIGQIQHNAHLYRTGQGLVGDGNVGWLPNGGLLQMVPLAIGQTVTFAINGADGMISNGCPSMVQVIWQ